MSTRLQAIRQQLRAPFPTSIRSLSNASQVGRSPPTIRFYLANPQLFWQLQTNSALAGYGFSPPRTNLIRGTYLDTRKRRIARAGFSCRQRETRDSIEMTLKSLDQANGAVHRRSEWQVTISTARPLDEWLESQVYERVQRIIGSEPLLPLFGLEQICIIGQLCYGDRAVAELSIDNVTVTTGPQDQVFHELEIELMPAMPESALTEIVQHLQDRWDLQPERLSKFERGLALIDNAP